MTVETAYFVLSHYAVKSMSNWLKYHLDVNDQGILSELPP